MRIDPTKSNRLFFEEGESLVLEPGAMLAYQNCQMKTEWAAGGILQKLKLYFFGGEPLLRNRFIAEDARAWISLEEQMPGQIQNERIRAGESSLIIRNGAYLGHTGNIELETKYQGIQGYWEGKGFTGIRAFVKEGEGTVLFHTSGAKVERILVDSDKGPVTIDNSMILAYSENLDCKLTPLGKGAGSKLFSGEGLVCEFKGKGVVYVSSGEKEVEKSLIKLFCQSTKESLVKYAKVGLVAGTVLAAGGIYVYMKTGVNYVQIFGDVLVDFTRDQGKRLNRSLSQV